MTEEQDGSLQMSSTFASYNATMHLPLDTITCSKDVWICLQPVDKSYALSWKPFSSREQSSVSSSVYWG